MTIATIAAPRRATRTAGRWRFTADAYHDLWARGFFPDGARTELIGGVIYEMPPIGAEHGFSTAYLTTKLARATPDSVYVASQSALVLGDDTVVQPDVMILRAEAMATVRLHRAEDVLLVVEVVWSTEAHDRRRKLPRYARAGVPEVWLVLVGRGRVEVHRTPVDGAYTVVTAHGPANAVASDAAPGLALRVADILGRPAGDAATGADAGP